MKTVLVVDDEEGIRLVCRMALKLAGYRVLEAATGEEALQVLEEEDPDAMLLDLRLPGIDGWEVLRRLRDASRIPPLPVIIISAHASPGTPAKAEALGSRGYLSKPFYISELTGLVERVLTA